MNLFLCFSKVFSKGEYVNLACSIVWLQLEGNISLLVRYLSIFPDEDANIFASALLISYCSF